MREVCQGIEERYSITFEIIEFDEDHAHFMIETFPRFSPSEVFRIVKRISVRELFKKYSNIKEEL